MSRRTSMIRAAARSYRRTTAGLALAATLLLSAGAALANPTPEYGPEAEARFLDQYAAASGASSSTGRCVAERLQDELGYPEFLVAATGGRTAYASGMDGRFAMALRRAEITCTARAALPAGR